MIKVLLTFPCAVSKKNILLFFILPEFEVLAAREQADALFAFGKQLPEAVNFFYFEDHSDDSDDWHGVIAGVYDTVCGDWFIRLCMMF